METFRLWKQGFARSFMMLISCHPATEVISHTPTMPRAKNTPIKGLYDQPSMTPVTTSSHPPPPMGPPRPLPTPPVTRSISRSTGSPSLVSSSSETMNEYPDDLRGTYSCEVIEPGTEGTEIIPMRKEISDQLHNDEEVEIDVVGTHREEKTEEYVEPSMPENFYHNVELLHGSPPSRDELLRINSASKHDTPPPECCPVSKDPTPPSECYPADEIEKEKIEEIDLTRNDVKESPD